MSYRSHGGVEGSLASVIEALGLWDKELARQTSGFRVSLGKVSDCVLRNNCKTWDGVENGLSVEENDSGVEFVLTPRLQPRWNSLDTAWQLLEGYRKPPEVLSARVCANHN